MSGTNPLNPLMGQIEKFEESDQQASKWESSRVEWTLKRLKLDIQRKQLMAEAGFDRGFTYINFARVAPSFPVDLVAEPRRGQLPIHRDTKAVHPLWFKAFRGLPFVADYEARFEECSKEGRPFGMVFPRKGFLQGMVLHNGDWELFVPPQSSCHLFKGGKKRTMTLIVQPYQSFIDQIRNGLKWRP